MNEKFQFTFRNTPGDFWIFYMTNTYHSLAGIVNIVFTAAAAALMISRWSSSGAMFHAVVFFALLIFPVLQPIAIYGRSVREAHSIKADTTVTFDAEGMQILVEHDRKQHLQNISWEKMNHIVKRKMFVMVFPDAAHGYLLTNRITGADRTRFEAFACSRMPAEKERISA